MDYERFLVATALSCAAVLFALLFSMCVGVLASAAGISAQLSVPIAWFIVLTVGVFYGRT